jgi:hypothetical protein
VSAAALDYEQQVVSVLTLEAVRWGVSTLKAAKVHPFFLAYLHLRKLAQEQGSTTDIAPAWDDLGRYLEVKGGPAGKPYFRPFWHGGSNDPGRYWLNPNIAGSYSPSSLRKAPYEVIDTEGSHFSLKPNHSVLARQALLFDTQINSLALSAFFYRDFGLISVGASQLKPEDLLTVFCDDFRFQPDSPEFADLFITDVPAHVETWFEPLDDDTVGVQ